MSDIGVLCSSSPSFDLTELDSGWVVPDVDVAEIHTEQQRVLTEQIRLAEQAESLGFDSLYHTEHHFSLASSNSPNPVLTQTAIAEETEDIRLIQMANILPWHEPIRLAEQLGELDLLSDGRVEVGIGRGSQKLEAAVLGQHWGGTLADKTRNRKSFEEKYEMLVRAWSDDLLDYDGEFHSVPPSYTEWEHNQEYHYFRAGQDEHDPSDYLTPNLGTTTLDSLPVVPQPQQDPHPQIWMPTGSDYTIRWAAEQGINGITLCRDFDDINRVVDTYEEAAADSDWPDHRPRYDGEPFELPWSGERRRGVACLLEVFDTDVASDDVFERWKLGKKYSACRSLGMNEEFESGDIEGDLDLDLEQEIDENQAPIVGGTEHITDQIAEFKRVVGYDDLVLVLRFGGFGLTWDEQIEQMESFGTEVLPEVQTV